MRFNEGFYRYTKELSSPKYNPITLEQERALLENYLKRGDTKSFQLIVNSYLRFVIFVLKEFDIPSDANIMDAVQEGNAGLIESIKRFDLSRPSRVSTYGVHWIRFYIAKSLKGDTHTSYVAYYTCKTHGGVYEGKEQSCNILGCTKSLTAIKKSIFSSYDSEEDINKKETIVGYKETQDQYQAVEDIKKEIKKVLPAREFLIIILRMGLNPPYEAKTLQEVGSILHLNFERVRQLESWALEQIKQTDGCWQRIEEIVSV